MNNSQYLELAMQQGRSDSFFSNKLRNKKRFEAKNFYEKIGFEASHEGMKLYLNTNFTNSQQNKLDCRTR